MLSSVHGGSLSHRSDLAHALRRAGAAQHAHRRPRHASAAAAARRGAGRRRQAGSDPRQPPPPLSSRACGPASPIGRPPAGSRTPTPGFIRATSPCATPALTGSYAAAALAGRLDAELPTMTALDSQARRRAVRRVAGSRAPPGTALAPARRAPHLAAGRRRRGRAGNPRLPGLAGRRSTTRRSRTGWPRSAGAIRVRR